MFWFLISLSIIYNTNQMFSTSMHGPNMGFQYDYKESLTDFLQC